MTWDAKVERSPESDFLKPEAFDSPILASIPPHNVSISPAVNPMELGNSAVDDIVVFGHEGINDTQPLFQSLPPLSRSSEPTTAISQPSPAIKNSPVPSPRLASRTPARGQQGTKRYPSRNLKRKSSGSTPTSADEGEGLSPSQRSSVSPAPRVRRDSKEPRESSALPKKTAHNMIEKRYRNNLNDKIASLRDAVPALRVMVHRMEPANSSEEDGGDEGAAAARLARRGSRAATAGAMDLGGLAPAHKLNKATILSKATEYIVHLERRNQNLARENDALRTRVEGLEMLVMGRGPAGTMWNQ